MKKKLSKSTYRFLFNELKSHKEKGIITQQQADDMMTYYEEDAGLSFIKVLVTIGSILIGLGIISFIASNWQEIGKVAKVLIIIVALAASLLSSYKLEKIYPKTSKALLYLSTLIYGAGIFLMEQTFNYSSEVTLGFSLWVFGTVVAALLFREKYIFVFSHILAMIYIGGSFNENIVIMSLIFVIVFYAGNKYFNHSNIVTFFNNLVALDFCLYFLNHLNLDGIYIAIFFFILGNLMYYVKHRLNPEVFKLQGIIVTGISGIFLTYKDIWQQLSFVGDGNYIAIVFGILIVLYFLSLVRKGSLIALIFTCIIILRYYFDTLYDFMPKSLFFIIGGFILLGFGYYFERLRKNEGGIIHEKDS